MSQLPHSHRLAVSTCLSTTFGDLWLCHSATKFQFCVFNFRGSSSCPWVQPGAEALYARPLPDRGEPLCGVHVDGVPWHPLSLPAGAPVTPVDQTHHSLVHQPLLRCHSYLMSPPFYFGHQTIYIRSFLAFV